MNDKSTLLRHMSDEHIREFANEIGVPITDKRWRVAAIADHLARKRSLTRERILTALSHSELAKAASEIGISTEGDERTIRSLILDAINQKSIKDARKLALSKIERVLVALPAKLIRVIDGDTVDLEVEGQKCQVRLRGVDAPETCERNKAKIDIEKSKIDPEQMYSMGAKATEWLKRKLNGKSLFVRVELTPLGPKKYLHHHQHRLLAYITLDAPDGEDIGESMLREGFGLIWPRMCNSRRYSHPNNEKYVQACHFAARERPGLWQMSMDHLCSSFNKNVFGLDDCLKCGLIAPNKT